MKTISLEHENYLKKINRKKIIVHIFQILLFLILLFLWEFFSKIHVINTFLFSSPSLIFKTIYHLFTDGELFSHISITLYEIFLSFSISLLVGLLIASLLWFFPFLEKIIDPYLIILNSLPKVALGPLIIIWFGAKIQSIVFMSLLISLFVTTLNIYSGFENVPDDYITMMNSFGANRFQIFRYVIFPYNRKIMIDTLKVNVSMNFIGVIMGELLVSKKGIGYLIMYGSQVFHIDLVISGVFILGIISYLLYFFIQKIK